MNNKFYFNFFYFLQNHTKSHNCLSIEAPASELALTQAAHAQPVRRSCGFSLSLQLRRSCEEVVKQLRSSCEATAQQLRLYEKERSSHTKKRTFVSYHKSYIGR